MQNRPPDSRRYTITEFGRRRPFSSFLPAIAGPLGAPMWALYVNRGQAISSFGVRDKDGSILEFHPACRAYQSVSRIGFRTFVRVRAGSVTRVFEPFGGESRPGDLRAMDIGENDLELTERSVSYGLETRVRYYTLTNEPFAALLRTVTIENLGNAPVDIEVLDGLSVL